MAASSIWKEPLREVLAMLPHRSPFLFLDELTRLDETGAAGRYRFKTDEYFFAGHFPGNPVVPGVIQIEAIAQVAVVAHGLYLFGLEKTREEVRQLMALFTDGSFEFVNRVHPGDAVEVRSDLVFFRRGKIRSKAELLLADGRVAAQATVSGMGVKQ